MWACFSDSEDNLFCSVENSGVPRDRVSGPEDPQDSEAGAKRGLAGRRVWCARKGGPLSIPALASPAVHVRAFTVAGTTNVSRLFSGRHTDLNLHY